jgi:Domain of unknown function (DUF5122) beta-propeller
MHVPITLSRGRSARALLGTALLAAVVALPVVPASAATNLPLIPGTTYQANGRVDAIVTVGNVIYFGGKFTSLRPAGAHAGTGEVARNRLAAVNRDTGALLPWNPNADKDVYALAVSPDGATIYAGGLFAKVGGVQHTRAAAISAATGVATSWSPALDGKVYAVAATATRVYLGGTFTKVNGTARTRLAAVSTAGALDATWHPSPDATVRAIAMGTDGSVLVGGEFFFVDGTNHSRHLVRLDPATAAQRQWNWMPGYDVWAIIPTATQIYLGGNGAGGHLAAHTAVGGKVWQVQTDGGVQAIALVGDTLIGGGHFDNVCVTSTTTGTGTGGGFECQEQLATRHKLISVATSTGALDPWNPGANSNLGVFALGSSSGKLQVGGDFTTIGSKSQQAYAQFG